MNDPQVPLLSELSPEERQSMLFNVLILQQADATMLFLGLTPHPETQKTVFDPDAARVSIDTLEMLEVKTRGNLTPREQEWLRDSLTQLRMAYVKALDHPPQPGRAKANEAPSAEPRPDEAHAPKFSRKY